MTGTTTYKTDFDPALNMARQSLFRFAALSLLDPRAGSWAQLDTLSESSLLSAAAGLVRESPAAEPESLGLGERSLVHLDPLPVLGRLPASPEALNDEYENTFGLLVSNACPPYETEYINSKFTFQRSNALADISGYYGAFGLTTSDAHPDRADHVVLELEFLGFLLAKQRLAHELDASLRHVADERIRVCRDAHLRFFEDHVAWWVPAFARLLGRENSGGFYGAIGVFLSALIPAERGLLGVAAPSHPVAPSAMERPEECDGCQLASS